MMPETKPEVTAEVTSQVSPEIPAQPQPGIIPETLPPAVPRTRWQRFLHWEFLGLAIIVLVTLIFHFVAIMRPPTIVWDEVWYVGDTRSIISRTGELRPEHPPLAKLFIVAGEYIFNGFKTPEHDTGATNLYVIYNSEANDNVIVVSDISQFKIGQTIRIDTEQMDITGLDVANSEITVKRNAGGSGTWNHNANDSIYVFTDNAFGWRFFSIIFGTIGIIIFYFICRKLKLSWKTSILATFLFAFENMTFLHSGLALLDIYMVTFMLAAVLMYLDEKYIWCGVFIALSADCKLAGALIFVAIFIHWAIYRKDKWKMMVGLIIAAILAFVVCLLLGDFLIKGGFENPITRINGLFSGTAANQFTIPKLSISSRPWAWIYPQFVDPYYNSPFIVYSYDPQYISFISTTIQILIIPTIGYMIYKAIWKKNQTAGLILLWVLATYVLWIPGDIVSNRVTFVFYFLSTTPAICIGLGMAISDWVDRMKNRRLMLNRTTPLQRTGYIFIGFWLLLHLAIFVVFNPAIPTIIKTWLPPFST
jgi:dolichyl-phosphate-mannose-protein mannosyltransferase